ncbi:MAG: hypothetical protein R3B96_17515 [Pirellulaceae bacterium]
MKLRWGQRWLASLLWERTGIEPFTIWQWSALRDAQEYRVVAEAIAGLGELHEPVFLWPPPGAESGLKDIPQVDAILVHPPDRSFAPPAGCHCSLTQCGKSMVDGLRRGGLS